MKNIDIPYSLISIGNEAFYSCSRIETITVDSDNPVYHSNGECLIETETKTLVLGCKNSIIPSDGSVRSIGHGAFWGCNDLTSITIPNGVDVIEECAFFFCEGLEKVTIDSVEKIGDSAFLGCVNLYDVSIGEGLRSIEYGAFDGCESLVNINLPEGLKSIGDVAFSGCVNLKSITIPKSVKSIGGGLFIECNSLTDIYFNGTENQWKRISISSEYNEVLNNVEIHFKKNSILPIILIIVFSWMFIAAIVVVAIVIVKKKKKAI